MSEDLRAAVAAGVVGSEESFRQLLQSVVEVARAIFGAQASSIFLLDEEADELVFEAVAGHGAETLLGIVMAEDLAEHVAAKHDSAGQRAEERSETRGHGGFAGARVTADRDQPGRRRLSSAALGQREVFTCA